MKWFRGWTPEQQIILAVLGLAYFFILLVFITDILFGAEDVDYTGAKEIFIYILGIVNGYLMGEIKNRKNGNN